MTAPVALVTGSTSGIGEGIARYFAAKGVRVVVNSRTSAAAGEALAAALPNATYLQADVADPDQAARLIERSVEFYGQLDVLVNNAGISRVVEHADLAGASPALWQELLQVNLIGPWVLTTAAVPYLEASPNGTVINITSHAGVRPKGASIPYAASKAALNHVTRLLAVALAPKVRVNAIAPGLVDTPLTAEWAEAQELWSTRAPMRRAATPDDVANLAWGLIENRYITGGVVVLDGGLNLR
jgi:NAD(P)-dependent dehydrogenase (short-subunit alcohol dehydrogenase family)